MFALIIFKKREKRDLKPLDVSDVDIVSRFIIHFQGVIFEVLLSRPRFLGHENRDRIINIRQGVTLAKSCVSVKEFWFWHFTVKLQLTAKGKSLKFLGRK